MDFTCYVAECDLSTGGTPPPPVTQIAPKGQSPGSYFQAASGAAAINVTLDFSRRDILKPFQQTGPVGSDDLLYSLPTIFGGAPASGEIALVLADSYDVSSNPPYGLMFDMDHPDGTPGQRQGCAVFLRTIWDDFYTLPPDEAQAGFLEAVAYVAVHELGHVFNLWHVAEASFMQAHPQLTPPGPYKFQDQQQDYLALAASPATAPFVVPGPGERPFGVLAPGFTSDDPSPFAAPPATDAVCVQIALTHDVLWSFEPIELDIEIAVSATAPGGLALPDELDPGYRTLQVWVTRPNGERVRFRPPVRFCGAGTQRIIAPGEIFRRDISVGRQSGDFTFATAGDYQVQVTLEALGGAVFTSNSVHCRVRPREAESPVWRRAHDLLGSIAAQRLLRFKRTAPSYLECAALAEFAEAHASAPTAATIQYALGKALALASAHSVHPGYAEDLARRSGVHLRSVVGHPGASAHRRQAAGVLLSGLESDENHGPQKRRDGRRSRPQAGPSRGGAGPSSEKPWT